MRQILPPFVFVCCLLMAAWSHAAGVNVTQALNFGQWFMQNNGGGYSVTVAADGGTSHTGSITSLRAARPGVYVITGLPANATVTNVAVTQTSALSSGGGETLTMDGFEITHDPVTDGAGNLNLRLGATAHFSGNGQAYGTGTYDGQLLLEFDVNL